MWMPRCASADVSKAGTLAMRDNGHGERTSQQECGCEHRHRDTQNRITSGSRWRFNPYDRKRPRDTEKEPSALMTEKYPETLKMSRTRGWSSSAKAANERKNIWPVARRTPGGGRPPRPALPAAAHHLLLLGALGTARLRRTPPPAGAGAAMPAAACCSRIFPMRSPRLLPTCRPTGCPAR